MSATFTTDLIPVEFGERFSGHGVTFEVIAVHPEESAFTTRVVAMASQLTGFHLGLELRWIPQPDQHYWYPQGFQGGWYELHVTEIGKRIERYA